MNDGENVPDDALLSGIAVGDEEAGLTFVRRYQRRLYGLALGIVGDAGDAEDVTQEAFIRIFRHAQVFDTRRGSVSTWALTITRNLAIDAIRLRRSVPTDPADPVFIGLMSNNPPTDAAALAAHDVARARRALATLPPEQRRAVLLAALYGRTAEQIAQSESIPLGTAKSRIRLGMARLRTGVEVEEPR